MIIESFHISGFGIFQDTGVASLTRGLTIIYAPNGSGKTTLRDFLRAALFGFQSKDNRYEPVSTTAHGGLLQVRDKNGQAYVIHFEVNNKGRAQSRVKLPDGQEGPPLEILLNAASPEIFRNIFTIGLSELQDAEGFNTSKEVQVMIGAFGGGHSGQSFLKWRKALEDEQGELFKPGGQKPQLNRKLAEFEKLQGQLKALQAEAEKYWGHEKELQEIEQAVACANEQRTLCNRRFSHLENLKKAWPDWIELCDVRRAFHELPLQVEAFPLQGLEKLEKLKERQQQQAVKVKQHREEQERYRQQLGKLQINGLLLEHSATLDEIWERLALYQENKKRFEESGRKISLLEKERAAKLAEMGNEWTVERALGFKDDVASRTEKSEIIRALFEKKQDLKQAAQELEQARREVDKRQAEYAQLRADFTGQWQVPPPGEDKLDEYHSVLTKCRALGLEENRARKDLAKNAEEIEECTQQLQRLEGQTSSAQPASKPGPVFLVVGAVILAVALILTVVFRENLPVMIASLVAGVIGVVLCWLFARQQANPVVPATSYFTEQREHLQQKKTKLEAEQAGLQTALQGLQEEIARVRQALGLSASDNTACDTYESELKKQREARRRFEREQLALKNAETQAERAAERVTELQVDWNHKEAQHTAVEQGWQNWLRAQGLKETLTVEAANATIEQLKKIGEIQNAYTDESHVAHALQTQIKAYEQDCQSLFQTLNQPVSHPADLGSGLRRLRSERDAEAEKAKQRGLLQEQLQNGEQAVPGLREEGRKLVQEFNELLAEGHARDESEFVSRAQAWQQRQELQGAERNLLGRLQILSAPGEALERLQSELALLDHETLQRQLEEAGQEALAVNDEFNRLNQRLGELQEARRRLASDDEVALCAQQLEQVKTELQELAGQWAVRRLAFRLMEKARRKFETERQPAVLQSAGESLKVISGGRYEGIMRPLGSSESHLIQPNGELRANEKIWNTALKEKVYLSLRFGLIETYNERLEPLPVVLDDALVNLDPRNMRGAAQAILQLAQKQQVIYLTCHPHTVEHFVAHEAPQVYEISGQGAFHLRG